VGGGVISETYRWPHPYAWLEEHTLQLDARELRCHLLALALRAGSDEIQELYESAMNEDGYFQPITKA
jgi:hypothetical protein